MGLRIVPGLPRAVRLSAIDDGPGWCRIHPDDVPQRVRLDDYDAYGQVPIPGEGRVELPAGDMKISFPR